MEEYIGLKMHVVDLITPTLQRKILRKQLLTLKKF